MRQNASVAALLLFGVLPFASSFHALQTLALHSSRVPLGSGVASRVRMVAPHCPDRQAMGFAKKIVTENVVGKTAIGTPASGRTSSFVLSRERGASPTSLRMSGDPDIFAALAEEQSDSGWINEQELMENSERAKPKPTPSTTIVRKFSWEKQWYPIAIERLTDRTHPFEFTLLGRSMVVWWDQVKSQWRCMLNECPHRLAPLSEGTVNEQGHIECPYHGWTFEGEGGQCMSIPQKPTRQPIQVKACGWAFPTALAQGLLWVYGEPLPPDCSWYNTCTLIPSQKSIPRCDAVDDPDFVTIDMFRDLPYDASVLLENLLDNSHLHYVHHRTVSNKARATPLSYVLTDPLDEAKGFNATWTIKSPEEEDALPAASSASVDMMDMVDLPPEPKAPAQPPRYSSFRPPGYMHHIVNLNGTEAWTVGYAVPMRPGRSRLIARFPFKFKKGAGPRALFGWYPQWLQHIGQNQVLEDDNIILHLQERSMVSAGGGNPATGMRANGLQKARPEAQAAFKEVYHMPTAADTLVSTYRQWLAGAGPTSWGRGADLGLGPAEGREALLDRYESHTRHCTACMGALTNVRRARALLAALALALPTVGRLALELAAPAALGWGGWGLVAGAVLAGGLWKALEALEMQFLRGSWPPKRNRKP